MTAPALGQAPPAGRTAGPSRTRPPRRVPDRLLPVLAGLALGVSLAAFGLWWARHSVPMADLQVYRAEGAAVLGGRDLYAFRVTPWRLPATYPPFAALLFTPVARLPLPAARAACVAADLVLLAALVHLSLRLAGVRVRRQLSLVLLGTAAALWLEPVFQTVIFGQINLAVAVLVLADLTRPAGARGKGLMLGLAAGVKITPALLAVHLALTGQRREAARAAAGFAASAALGLALLPRASLDFWTARLYETGRVGKVWIVDNQSLQGPLARVLHTPDPGPLWAAAALLTAAAGLAVAARAHRHGRPALGLLCAAVTALLVSPVSWTHHWVWCVPLLALAAARIGDPAVRAPVRGRWTRIAVLAGGAAVFYGRSMWQVPHAGDLDLHLPWWQQPLAAPYPLLGLALLAGTALSTRPRRTEYVAGSAPAARPVEWTP
ncbi:alpha-1,2-mannosyltransferase [Actinacidiphila alni]|uniref:Alpha-1,2-mannosyltransferase n=1 Tax=Actinacidiphila alni TaxID=380248 RepID=A0A1I2ILQ4_9ACTN|nr:glycosyltransferase 87 family protein [Actinacidiphila alni]SFF43269.1 alpha-1,2-mannosyltransferase [Actinacidiphila alni]